MKKLLLLLVMSVSLTSYSQDTTKIDLTVGQVYQDAKVGFAQLVQKLEGPSKHVYQAYVVQNKIMGWVMFLVGCLLTLATLILFSTISRRQKLDKYDDTDSLEIAAWIGVALLTIMWIVFAFCGISRIVNPEYHAIQDLLEHIK